MKRALVAAITVFAVIVFFGTLAQAIWISPESDIPVPPGETVQRTLPPAEDPVTLKIPRINVDAKIQQTGVNAKGNMGVPTNFTDVAWYKHGTVPGQIGSAVIDGHVDNGLGLDGVFKHLSSLQVGDDVYVVTETGRQLHFVVSDVETYPYKAVPLNDVFLKNDDARLNLITCDGTWVKGDKTYNQRLVIYTKLVG